MVAFSNGFLLSLSLCLDIGIANIAMMTLAMQRGYAQGFCLGLGTCVGDLLYAIGALLGMSVLLQFTPVRWLLWIGGRAILLWFTFKMGREALQSHQQIDLNHSIYPSSASKAFRKGVVWAVSSPTAILWFATVGGVLISRLGHQGTWVVVWFLAGFFVAGLFWAAVLCGVGSFGGKVLGENLLRYSYMASAVIFAYFSVYVMVSGYREFFPT